MQSTTMPRLGTELDKESYIWLAANHPNILEAIEAEVSAGHTPQQIRLYVLRMTGRSEIAMRCESAARFAAASVQGA